MILYTIELEGDYITFVGETGTPKEGTKRSHRKSAVKELLTNTNDNNLTLVIIDDNTVSYNYKEVEDPSTVGVAFIDLDTFRTYMLTNLAV